MPSSPVKRASLPLSEGDVALLRLLEDPTTPEGKRLAELAGDRSIASEAALLKAVFELGLERVRADVMFEGYQQLAVSCVSDDEVRYTDALKRRTRRHHQDAE